MPSSHKIYLDHIKTPYGANTARFAPGMPAAGIGQNTAVFALYRILAPQAVKYTLTIPERFTGQNKGLLGYYKKLNRIKANIQPRENNPGQYQHKKEV